MTSSSYNLDEIIITSFSVHDVRFPTSLDSTGSDAMHTAPDYTAAYCILHTSIPLSGHGLTFTLGHGTSLITSCIQLLAPHLLHKPLSSLINSIPNTSASLATSQLRWLGPNSGVLHLARAAVINAIWDLWAKAVEKPLWQLLVDMPVDDLIRQIDFRYISDAITPEEARNIFTFEGYTKERRYSRVYAEAKAVRGYTTSAGWLHYPSDRVRRELESSLSKGFTHFKIKVGANLDGDKARLRMVRSVIGAENTIMIDANQVWGTKEAVEWVSELAEFRPWFIEEPTSPYDILGHKAIREGLKPHDIKVATGEMCANAIMFKQLITSGAVDIAQIDACRLAGPSEILAVFAIARKYDIPVIPHSGGVGLTELTTHFAIIDYVLFNGRGGLLEYLEEEGGGLHRHFVDPAQFSKGWVITPVVPGGGGEMKEESLLKYEFPGGEYWKSEEGRRVAEKWVGEV
ncbi:L-galactonate dehydratase [Ascodesmis nigricans]|uniref:L-galactonate dehydratase n=1 Tax=Ascodesmis nigricans TaxID=341454 RepID=A0A4V6RHJ5_9PEZI|nr:L-galactonate dehydratase [Ascodesmis nigricans]